MGLSSYSAPADAGVLCIILVNTAISISIVKEIVCSLLHVVGIRTSSSSSSWDEFSIDTPTITAVDRTPSDLYVEEFRSRSPAIRYDSVCTHKQECSVCLAEFKPEAEINHLSCGHVFHKTCLEKWLKCWNVTCPLCRNCVMRMAAQEEEEEEEGDCPM